MIGLGLIFAFLPLHFIQAGWWDDVAGGLLDIGSFVVTLPLRIVAFFLTFGLSLLALAGGFVFFLVASLLNWVISALLQVGITPGNPATPEIINIGWTFSRDFVNMLFILILVFTGLATILRLETYQAKKLLPALILIALLVNFSYVIVGFIVDVGNILTNFFLSNIAVVSNFSNIWTLAWGYFTSSVVGIFTTLADPLSVIGQLIGIIVYGIILLIFYFFASLVYFVVMIIFFFRILMLWILTILAPLAFASYILPATRKWWKEWWQQLIQWTIVGIPIGFFLYLSSWLMTNMSEVGTIFGSTPDFSDVISEVSGISGLLEVLTEGLASLITSILAPFLALAFLAIGVMISMQLAPSGAKGVIGWGKKLGMGALAIGGVAAGTALGRKFGPKVESWGKRLAERGLKPAEPPKGWKKVPAAAVKYTGIARIGRWAARAGGPGLEMAGGEATAAVERAERKRTEGAKIKASPSIEAFYGVLRRGKARKKMPWGEQTIIGALEAGHEKGWLLKAKEEGIISEEMIKIFVQKAEKKGRKSLLGYNPSYSADWQKADQTITTNQGKIESLEKELPPDLGVIGDTGPAAAAAVIKAGELKKAKEKIKRELENNIEEAERKQAEILIKIPAQAVEHISEDFLRNEGGVKRVIDSFTGKKMAEIAENFGGEIVHGIQKAIQAEDFVELARKNPSLTSWLYGPGAQGAGFQPPESGKNFYSPKIRGKELKRARERGTANLETRKGILKEQYKGKEQLLIKEYYLPERTKEGKTIVKEIIEGLGKTIPTKRELEAKIGSLETQLNRTYKQWRKAKTNLQRQQIEAKQEDISKEIEIKLKDFWK